MQDATNAAAATGPALQDCLWEVCEPANGQSSRFVVWSALLQDQLPTPPAQGS